MNSDTRKAVKALAGLEDILVGAGTKNQNRNNIVVPITKLNSTNIPYSGDEETEDFLSIFDAIELITEGFSGALAFGAENTTPIDSIYATKEKNLGIGVVPRVWTSTYKALQLGVGGSIAFDELGNVYLANNLYFSNGWKHLEDGVASLRTLTLTGGETFSTAVTANADEDATLVVLQTLAANGNLALTANLTGIVAILANSITVTTVNSDVVNSDVVNSDVIDETTADAGVIIEGVLLKDSEVNVDVINESTLDEGVTIDSVLLKDGNLVPVDGSGVDFSANSVGSSDPNVFDDYEKGNWTPAYTSATAQPTTGAFGRYIKMGGKVTLTFGFYGATENLIGWSGSVTGTPFTGVEWSTGSIVQQNVTTNNVLGLRMGSTLSVLEKDGDFGTPTITNNTGAKFFIATITHDV